MITKYTSSENFEVLDKEKESVLKSFLAKTGKVAASNLTEEEMEELRVQLANQDTG